VGNSFILAGGQFHEANHSYPYDIFKLLP